MKKSDILLIITLAVLVVSFINGLNIWSRIGLIMCSVALFIDIIYELKRYLGNGRK